MTFFYVPFALMMTLLRDLDWCEALLRRCVILVAALQRLPSRQCPACRVGIELEKVEVRLQGVTVRARATAAGRALPSIFNSYRNWLEVPPLSP